MSTDDIVEVLAKWDERYGVDVSDAKGDSLAVSFLSVPEQLDDFFREIVRLYPDAIESKRELLDELSRNQMLFLWWD